MSAIPCPVCLSGTRDGLLCATCTAALRATLRHLPELMRELRVTLTRQNQGARSGGRGTGETPLPFNVNASEVFYSVTNTVGTWIRDIDEHADIPRRRTVRRCVCPPPAKTKVVKVERCELSDLPTEMCAHCRGLDKPKPASIAERIIEAEYNTGCPACSGEIDEGEPIGLVDGDWVCADCFTFDSPGAS